MDNKLRKPPALGTLAHEEFGLVHTELPEGVVQLPDCGTSDDDTLTSVNAKRKTYLHQTDRLTPGALRNLRSIQLT